MLEDRDYMRQPEYNEPRWRPRFRFQWSWTVIFLIAYAVVFVAELVAQKFFPDNNFFQGHQILTKETVEMLPGYLPLSVEGLKHGYVWQLVTYQFMHAGWFHIIANSWVIYVFGREVESILGGKRFLALMFSSGIVGGVFQVLVALVWPQYFGGSVVGASACGFGLVTVFAMLFPERELTMLIFFVIPVHMRAKTLLIGSVALAVTGFAFPNVIMPGVAHAAHLGGMAMGWFFVRKVLPGGWPRLEGTVRPAERFIARRQAPEPFEKIPAASFVEEEVDPILDKISAHGIQSLTARERETLEKARAKMAKR
ncbi:MAG TPA: rhomboid family intramembrane serine protease [Verrucomicrobiae bacterium]|jgi:membrane associated rhomboid family serine protease|nr:rhomboid family intramembrane serine protease [Verrucomicrobiae bacterium]